MRQDSSLVFALAAAAALPAPTAGAEVFAVQFALPTLDRWMYPFNFTPGARVVGSTFGALGEADFDDRDGQVLLGFDTGGQVPAGRGRPYYRVTSATLRIACFDGGFLFDDTYDPIASYSSATDPDARDGRPAELFGAGFRGGFGAPSFLENSPFGSPRGSYFTGVRNAFATDFFEGVPTDVSNNVSGRPDLGQEPFEVIPFAIGVADGVEPGDVVPFDTDFVFELNLASADVLGYLRAGLDGGRLRFVLSSLHPAVQQGGEFVNWYMKENARGAGRAARLTMTVEVLDPLAGDVNLDGAVDTADLGLLLGAFGVAPPPPGPDINGDGAVDTADLGLLLNAFGSSLP